MWRAAYGEVWPAIFDVLKPSVSLQANRSKFESSGQVLASDGIGQNVRSTCLAVFLMQYMLQGALVVKARNSWRGNCHPLLDLRLGRC